MSITKQEIDIQIALGTITNSQELARHIKKSTDPEALAWAIRHKNTGVRMAAAKNPNTPVGTLIEAYVFESTVTVSNAMYDIVTFLRKEEVKKALALVKDYPQFSLDLK